MNKTLMLAAILASPCAAEAANDAELAAIRAQLGEMKQHYEARIAALENRLAQAEAGLANAAPAAPSTPAPLAAPTVSGAAMSGAGAAAFNPEISLILSGNFSNLSQDPARRRLQGFMPNGGEQLPEARSFHLGESELAIAANIDPYFRGNLRLALAPDNTLAVEEASIQTLALGNGLNLKAGRFLSGIGYLNERHPHEWDFSDAPLPYQAFFGNALGLDGIQLRWLAPSELFVEFGAEAARARGFPSSDAERNKNGLLSAAVFAHVGGDIGEEQSWRSGLSFFNTRAGERRYDDPLNGIGNAFTGSSRTWIADWLWKWAPQGNASERNLKVQGEYFRRSETGDLSYDTAAPQTGGYRVRQSGYYAQAVWQFRPAWRLGYRYDRLDAGSAHIGLVDQGSLTLADLPVLAAYAPRRHSLMVDWSPSEFSRLRLQLAEDKTRPEATDHQLWLQYVVSLGAHGAHKF